MFTQRYRTSSTRRTTLRNWTKQMQILWIISLIQCRCDGNHWHQMQHCISGTFSDGCRSASSRTQNRKRGSILSKQRPLHVNCSMDTSTGPAKQKKKRSLKALNTKLFLVLNTNGQHKMTLYSFISSFRISSPFRMFSAGFLAFSIFLRSLEMSS